MKRISCAQLVALHGPDAVTFAHSQFTSHVANLAIGDWQWSAWLDAQGRVRNVFALLRPESERLIVWLPMGDAEALQANLARFVFRAKVRVECLRGWSLSTSALPARSESPPHLTALNDGFSFYLDDVARRQVILAPDGSHTEPPDLEALNDWTLSDIHAGFPWIGEETRGQFVAHALDLQRIGAISLDKGCYPGQEIVARLHYRGGNKRHCEQIRISSTEPPVSGGAILTEHSDSPAGNILYSARENDAYVGLAVLAEGASAGHLSLADGTEVHMQLNPWRKPSAS
jgi:folate-binding protein YgfZ